MATVILHAFCPDVDRTKEEAEKAAEGVEIKADETLYIVSTIIDMVYVCL